MNATEALGRLRALGVRVLTTADAAAALGAGIEATSQTLRRLGRARLVFSLRKGLWALDSLPDPITLAEYVASPYAAYVSLQSALYLRHMIDQIPDLVYVVSLGRRATVRTAVGTYSIHHLPAELFGGFEHDPGTGVKLARAEKALFDVLYLSGTRTRLFRSLPELELPRGFALREVKRWIGTIRSARLRELVSRRLEAARWPGHRA
jgi:predicted transcriptional regulator of viral defense system